MKPHGDITYDQASRAVSFLDHISVRQQSQRATAYGFSKKLKCLLEYVHMLLKTHTSSALTLMTEVAVITLLYKISMPSFSACENKSNFLMV